jgi:hypothetical protein
MYVHLYTVYVYSSRLASEAETFRHVRTANNT